MTGVQTCALPISGVTGDRGLQLLLMDSLDFPGWYGCNWNAFWDAITGLVAMPKKLRIRGWSLLAERFPADAQSMQECLEDMAAKYPEYAAEVEYV